MPSNHVYKWSLLFLFASVIFVSAQRRTIPESLAQAGTSLTAGMTIPSGRPPALDEVLAETDLVVRGIVGESRSYLSDDQRDVYTDYEIRSPVILYQEDVVETPVPRKATPLNVTIIGGTVAINGLTFTAINEALPKLEEGTECLFLLRRLSQKYVPVGQFYGVFGSQDGRLKPLTKKQGFAPELSSVSVRQAQESIVAKVRKRSG